MPNIIDARNQILADHATKTCVRCEGHGTREDRPGWRPVNQRGKVCFRCKGSGTEPAIPDPLVVRRNVSTKLRGADRRAVARLRAQLKGGLYWPVLADLFEAPVLEPLDPVLEPTVQALDYPWFVEALSVHENASDEEMAEALGYDLGFLGGVYRSR